MPNNAPGCDPTPAASSAADAAPRRPWPLWLIFGILCGLILTKAEVISWFRIQEMFRFQAFHMYGIIGSAIAVGAACNLLRRRRERRRLGGAPSAMPEPSIGWGYRY